MKPTKLILIGLIFMWAGIANAQMVLEYNITTINTQVALPLAGTVNVSVNWGDGSAAEAFTTAGIKPHTFTTTGTKTVTITGTLTAYGSASIGAGNESLTKVLSWNGLGLTNFSYAFYAASSLTQVPASLPPNVTNMTGMFAYAYVFNQPIGSWNTAAVTNMSNMFATALAFNQPIGSWNTAAVTDMGWMFSNASSFNQPIGNWNTTAVKNMSFMFGSASSFNQPIGNWNTAAVKNMGSMFYRASVFNQPIGSWNTAAVTDMGYMFQFAGAFNQPIGTWNISAVTNMNSMFYQAITFNQPIGTWNTNTVTNMAAMFYQATAFNQSIGAWNTTSVTTMNAMFYNATAFNQPIGLWNIAAVTVMGNMFNGTALCTDNYDNLLNGWAPQAVKTGVTFHGGTSKYSPASAAARAVLIGKSWTITDAGTGTTAGAKCTATGIEDESIHESETILYPNPVKNKLTIRFAKPANELLTYSIFNITGLLVLEKEIQNDGASIEIGLEALSQGAYIIKIKSNENVIVRSFVKE